MKKSIEEFKEEFISALEKRLSSANMEILTDEVVKNNDLRMTGICIKDTSKDYNISPTMYLENIYKEYDGSNISQLADYVMHQMESAEVGNDFDITRITDINYVKFNVYLKVINAESNYKYLLDKPYIPVNGFEDLVAVAKINIKVGEADGSSVVTDSLLENLQISKEQLFDYARSNSQYNEPKSFFSLTDFLLNPSAINDSLEDSLSDEKSPIYILTNKSKLFGASVITYDGVFDEIYEKLGESFTIIPSSIHEVLILRDSVFDDNEEILGIVDMVNSTEVAPDEILSANIYHFNGVSKEIETIYAAEREAGAEL